MNRIINNLTDSEKKTILNQLAGEMKVGNKNLSKLLSSKSQSDYWSKYPCVAKLNDGVSPNGHKFKTDGNIQYYSNGRAMDSVSNETYNYECGDGDEILTS
jgi:hypothetical protein